MGKRDVPSVGELGGGRVDEFPELGSELFAEDFDVEVVGEEEGDAVVFGDEVLWAVSDPAQNTKGW